MISLQNKNTTLEQRYTEYKNTAKEIVLELLKMISDKKKWDMDYTWKDIKNYEYGYTTRQLSRDINFEYGGHMLFDRLFGFDADYKYNWSFRNKFTHEKDRKSFVRKLFRNALNELKKENKIQHVRERIYLYSPDGQVNIELKKYWIITK